MGIKCIPSIINMDGLHGHRFIPFFIKHWWITWVYQLTKYKYGTKFKVKMANLEEELYIYKMFFQPKELYRD